MGELRRRSVRGLAVCSAVFRNGLRKALREDPDIDEARKPLGCSPRRTSCVERGGHIPASFGTGGFLMSMKPLGLVTVAADRFALDLKAVALVGHTDGAFLFLSTS